MNLDKLRTQLAEGAIQDREKSLTRFDFQFGTSAADVFKAVHAALASGERIEVVAHQSTWERARGRMKIVTDAFRMTDYEFEQREGADGLGERAWQFTSAPPVDPEPEESPVTVVEIEEGVDSYASVISRIMLAVNLGNTAYVEVLDPGERGINSIDAWTPNDLKNICHDIEKEHGLDGVKTYHSTEKRDGEIWFYTHVWKEEDPQFR